MKTTLIQWMREEDGFVSPFCQWIKKIVLFGVSGFPDLARGALENLSTQGADVESVIFCTGEDDLNAFDDFGRPIRHCGKKTTSIG